MELSDEELLERVIKLARAERQGRFRRYIAVADRFAIGYDDATKLCKRFKIDPMEYVQ